MSHFPYLYRLPKLELKILQRFEQCKIIRQQKVEQIAILRSELNAIHRMVRDLKSLLPKYSGAHTSNPKEVKPKSVKAALGKKQQPSSELVSKEIQTLEEELSEIEQKLESLA